MLTYPWPRLVSVFHPYWCDPLKLLLFYWTPPTSLEAPPTSFEAPPTSLKAPPTSFKAPPTSIFWFFVPFVPIGRLLIRLGQGSTVAVFAFVVGRRGKLRRGREHIVVVHRVRSDAQTALALFSVEYDVFYELSDVVPLTMEVLLHGSSNYDFDRNKQIISANLKSYQRIQTIWVI